MIMPLMLTDNAVHFSGRGPNQRISPASVCSAKDARLHASALHHMSPYNTRVPVPHESLHHTSPCITRVPAPHLLSLALTG